MIVLSNDDAMLNGESAQPEKRFGLLEQCRKAALMTKEDPLHIHKSLGVLCLASFAWRLSQWGKESDMAFSSSSHPNWTLPTLLLHLMLNASSLVFRIPSRRIDSGYRIWPEYRLHSLVFLARSLATMALTWYEDTFDLPPNYWMNLSIVLAAMLSSDLASSWCGNQSGFCRRLEVPEGVKYFFSVMQLSATAGCLYGMRRYSIQFIFCMTIQCNAFLMTLRRKNLARQSMLVTVYGIMLVGGGLLCVAEVYFWQGTHAILVLVITASTASVMRLSPRLPLLRVFQNKYVLWIGMSLVVRHLRTLEVGVELYCVAVVSEFSMIALGFYKSKKKLS
jgi:hypothetical protein